MDEGEILKVLYVDTFVDGHHVAYLKGLLKDSNTDVSIVLPEKIELDSAYKQIVIKYDVKQRSLKYDLFWLNQVYLVAEKVKPDIIHFLYGDILYRNLGIGFSKFRKFATIVTFHVIKNDLKHRIGMKFIACRIDKGVIHTDVLYNQLSDWGIRNITKIEYPCFFPMNSKSMEDLRKKYNIPLTTPVLLAIGGTREYKGLNYLLDALKKVSKDFHLLIAGSEEFFTKEFIDKEIETYSNKVTTILHQLTDEEFMDCLQMSDWIVLPYKKTFTGASGPLAEGVKYGKRIIGVDTGSIGELIRKYNLGYCFEAENVEDLRKKINLAIDADTKIDELYCQYQNALNPDSFYRSYLNTYRGLLDDKQI